MLSLLPLLAGLAGAAPSPTLQHPPEGCWEVVGRASWSWAQGRRRAARGDAGFIGRLEDGVWVDVVVRSLGEEVEEPRASTVRRYDHQQPHFLPMVGVVDDQRRPPEWASGDALVAGVVHALRHGDAAVSWDELPDGDTLAARLVADLPFTVTAHRRLRVTDARATLTGRALEGTLFPEAEVLTFDVAAGAFRATASQTIAYRTFRPCGGDTSDAFRPLVP